MTLIICPWSNRYFKVINIQQYSLCFVTAFTSGKKNARNNCLTSNLTFKPGFMTCKILVVVLIHFLDIATSLQQTLRSVKK